MRHLLMVISLLPPSKDLILRGNLLMPAWFGEAAREPDDTEWVVFPTTIRVDDE